MCPGGILAWGFLGTLDAASIGLFLEEPRLRGAKHNAGEMGLLQGFPTIHRLPSDVLSHPTPGPPHHHLPHSQFLLQPPPGLTASHWTCLEKNGLVSIMG